MRLITFRKGRFLSALIGLLGDLKFITNRQDRVFREQLAETPRLSKTIADLGKRHDIDYLLGESNW